MFDPWDNPVDRVLVELLQFRNARDWGQFHNSKDLALALSVEASELLELFLWKENEEANPEKLKEELADVFLYGLLLMHKHGFDFEEILRQKIEANEKKYPVSKAKGSAKKYNEL
ncbi:nucleotide pyrophosphohydrolase [Algoriphagus sp. AK58]|nr:nucleotide pyrophosphohydrolase [Algoriphagus sp. AK58]